MDVRIKAITCDNGSVKIRWVQKEYISSPTAYLKTIILTSGIYVKEYRDSVTIDIPNIFIQTRIDRKPGEDKVIIKINVVLVYMLV